MSDSATTIFDHLTDRVIAFSPCFAKIGGSLASGVLLAQLLYWHKAMDGKEFYKTDAEWIDETGLSRHEFRSAKAKLKAIGFVSTKLKKSPAITHYKVNKSAIIKAISSLPKSGKLDCRNPANKNTEIRQTGLPKSGKHIHTEITSEITSENTTTSESAEKFKPAIQKPPANGHNGHHLPPHNPPDHVDMALAERKAQQIADCKAFLEYAVEQHKSERGVTLCLDPERDAGHVIRMIRDKGFSRNVLERCWDEFVRIETKFYMGKTRTIPLFVAPNVFQEMLEKTRAVEREGGQKMVEDAAIPKINLDPDTVALWERCQAWLASPTSEILPENYNTWLADTVGIKITRDRVVIGVSNRYIAECLAENYSQKIKQALASVKVSPVPKLEFIEYEVVDA